jgi:glycosyltransferase involved in cell wall biosynthesis
MTVAEHCALPRISVIVAVFNGASTIQRCIDSVASQTYDNKELIIIDGGSQDGTLAILEKETKEIDYWNSAPDKGIYNAWNKGLERATGEWICFLGADDYLWDSQVLERLSSHLTTAYPSIRVVYGKIHVVSAVGRVHAVIGIPWRKAKKWFPYIMNIPHPGLMHHRSLFDVHGRFDESFRIAGDYELLLRELKSEDAMYVPELVTVGMQGGGVSHATGSMKTIRNELRKIRRMHQLDQSNWRRLWIDSKIVTKIALHQVLHRSPSLI